MGKAKAKKLQKPRKKNVVILVEGKSDRTLLELALPELFERIDENYEVHFSMIYEDETDKGGDITAKKGITPSTIVGCINKLFLARVLEEKKFYAQDITEIIHLVDLDGVYVPDECIHIGVNPNGIDRTYYAEDSIITNDVQKIVFRNQTKRDNLQALLALPNTIRVWHNPNNVRSDQTEVRYSIYYFSCNLDHFIQHNANLPSSQLKLQVAEEFRDKYINDLDGFVDFFLSDTDCSGQLSYVDSWTYIQQRNMNSLSRRTNIDVLLRRLRNEAQDVNGTSNML